MLQGINRIAPVIIGNHSWLGQNVVVLPGVTIGEHCVIGANSVVRSPIPDYCVAVGAPARVVRRFNRDSQNGKAWDGLGISMNLSPALAIHPGKRTANENKTTTGDQGNIIFVTRFGPTRLRSLAFDEKYRRGDWNFKEGRLQSIGFNDPKDLTCGVSIDSGVRRSLDSLQFRADSVLSVLGLDLSQRRCISPAG